MDDLSPTTTFKRNLLFTLSLDYVEVSWTPPLPPSLKYTIATRKSAENAMPLSPSKPLTAARESVVIPINSDSRKSQKIDRKVKLI